MMAGGSAGVLSSIAVTPIDNIRIIMQSQTNKTGTRGKYTGSYDVSENFKYWYCIYNKIFEVTVFSDSYYAT